MKYVVILLLSVSITFSQDEDPFGDGGSNVVPDEMEYDFDDIHKWDDVMVELGGKGDPKHLIWLSTSVSSHRGVKGKSQTFSFKLGAKMYKSALEHSENNRGVVLMSGDRRFPSLYCWLRPMSVEDGFAYFYLSIPPERLKDLQIAFLPNEGKKRYVYDLVSVAKALKKKPKARR